MNTTLHFTTDGRFHCESLAPILRAAGRSGMKPVHIGGGPQPGDIGCESCPQFIKCGMSHVSAVATEITDLSAVKALCAEMGWQFKEGQKKWKWYGSWQNDYSAADAAYKQGIDPKEYGKCDHAIGVPGTDWEIGLVKNQKTGGYKLVFDFYGSKGRPLQEAIGQGGGKFLQLYGVHKATLIAKSKGYYVNRTTLANGTVKLVVSGM